MNPGTRHRHLRSAGQRAIIQSATPPSRSAAPPVPDVPVGGTTAQQVGHIDAYLARTPDGPRAWGICTECGMGRVAADDVPVLLDLHGTILGRPGPDR